MLRPAMPEGLSNVTFSSPAPLPPLRLASSQVLA
jgi:hypothetical protein